MEKTLNLAEKGKFRVCPNPMVGCLIVYENTIIGEGYHEYYGGKHAEVNAIESVKNKELLKESTVYVSLEPCAHYGKTPPCANLLIENKIKKVVIATKDPNPMVAGKGIDLLKKAGIEVEIGILEDQAKALNAPFFYFFEQNRPYITIKFASSLDNFIAKKNGEPVVFSNSSSKEKVHELRAKHHGILVGINTILNDNPELNSRLINARSPIKIILDPNNKISADAKVLLEGEPSLVFNTNIAEINGKNEWIKVSKINFLEEVLNQLVQKKIQSILVEGGTYTIEKFVEKGFINKLIQIKNSKNLSDGLAGPNILFPIEKTEKIGEDNTWIYYSTQPKT